jgi:hypothetical protein
MFACVVASSEIALGWVGRISFCSASPASL